MSKNARLKVRMMVTSTTTHVAVRASGGVGHETFFISSSVSISASTAAGFEVHFRISQ